MVKDSSAIEVDGTIIDMVWGGDYRIKLKDIDMVVLASKAWKMKKNNITIIPGDEVKVELNEIDPTKGRITYRFPTAKWPRPPQNNSWGSMRR